MDIFDVCELMVGKLLMQTTAGTNVFNNRIIAVQDMEMPCIIVFAPTDIQPQPGILISNIDVVCFLATKDSENIAQEILQFNGDVKNALYRFWQDGLDITGDYYGRDTIYKVEASKPHAISKLTYQVQQLTDE